jgi:cobalt-zinc-cadmium efflux system membrane fusion protein
VYIPLSKRRRVLLAFAALCVVVGALVWRVLVRHDAPDEVAKPPAILRREGSSIIVPDRSPLRQSLIVQPVARTAIEVPFVLPAVIEIDPAKYFKALTPLVGRVTRLGKNIGDRVAVGDVLFSLEAPDLVQAASDLEKARAAVALTKAALDRQRALGTVEIAARREIEQAESDHAQAQSEERRAAARLAQLGVGADGARSLTVRSSQSGFVVEENASAGAYWNDLTAPLMTIADLSTVFVAASADEHDVGRVFLGQAAGVSLDAYPGETFAATVRSIAPLLDADTRRLKVRMALANADGRLKPGMFASAVFHGKAHAGLRVPIDAVVQSGFDSRVFVEVAPWTFEPRVVKLGPRIQSDAGSEIEIVDGLAPDSRVVVRNGVLLNE